MRSPPSRISPYSRWTERSFLDGVVGPRAPTNLSDHRVLLSSTSPRMYDDMHDHMRMRPTHKIEWRWRVQERTPKSPDRGTREGRLDFFTNGIDLTEATETHSQKRKEERRRMYYSLPFLNFRPGQCPQPMTGFIKLTAPALESLVAELLAIFRLCASPRAGCARDAKGADPRTVLSGPLHEHRLCCV